MRAQFGSYLEAACWAYFAVITRGGRVNRFVRTAGAYFVYYDNGAYHD